MAGICSGYASKQSWYAERRKEEEKEKGRREKEEEEGEAEDEEEGEKEIDKPINHWRD